jgi:hypothetical protein
MTTPKFPEITVALTGENGNAFAVMGRVSTAMKDAGVRAELIEEYMDESMAGDYDALLATAMKWVDVT